MKRRKGKFSYTTDLLRIAQVGIVLAIGCGILALFTKVGAALLIVLLLVLLGGSMFYSKRLSSLLEQEIDKKVNILTDLRSNLFVHADIPVVILENNGIIKWANNAFKKIWQQEEIIGLSIKTGLENLKINELFQKEGTVAKDIHLQDKDYHIVVERIEKQRLTVLYFMDYTENLLLKKRIKQQRCLLGYLCIDNYDEIMHSIEEVRRPMFMAIIDRKINLWFKEREVIILRFEKDKYLMVFNKKELDTMIERKFDILDEVRHIQVGNELPATISIGVGYNLESLTASREEARAAFDLAQGRGGDQAIIKNNDKYTFFGGKSKEVEKSARVKVRIKAYAFKELLHECDKVYIMGHKGIDMDCLGAAMGVYRAAAIMGKKAHIVLDEPTFAIQGLYDRIMTSNEYEDLFIPREIALEGIKKDTLLVIVDVHRRSYLEEEALLDKAEKVVVFDHHRRSTDFIEDAVLTYLEPYISSTCEMISEILVYLTDKIKLTPIEADALLAGITIDTKNFAFKAGVRTFEAAAFLRRSGADSSRVRMLFQNDMETYRARAAAIKAAEMWEHNIAVAEVDSAAPHPHIIAAQVADELLNIKGIEASFVITAKEDYCMISARALGDMNVQRIMELLGGGGHLGVAGAQLKNVTPYEAKLELQEAIDKYYKEGETK
ncbi:phosphoesterase [Sporanaerobium hydrogeniformans]|uniref:Phosphoesterase n=1 Tax=Sporanaerobium hydrogeniformans TaxID=3072179 RepID=A0AC61D931_9FIRM|nr:DHH family phosphoesterase [Sporanaerobium hydrogeniformans]PHV69216.1 phosphoesterase [Sporanaerobium hydrogeniformans]